MTQLIGILIVVFLLFLLILLGIAIWHPRFPEEEGSIPSLLGSSESSDGEDGADHTVLYPELKKRFVDLEMFMAADIMPEGILLHWLGKTASDQKILLDVTEEKAADLVVRALQKLHWHQGRAVCDLYVLIRSGRKNRAFFTHLLQERELVFAGVLTETNGLLRCGKETYVMLAAERFASIDFRLHGDRETAAAIRERYEKKMPCRLDGTAREILAAQKKELGRGISPKLSLLSEKAAGQLLKTMPFSEIWMRPKAELIDEDEPVIRLSARDDEELEKGISAMASILEETDTAYGISRQKRSVLTSQPGCILIPLLEKAAGGTPVLYGDTELEGWPGMNTIGFAPWFKNEENDREQQLAFYSRLLAEETEQN